MRKVVPPLIAALLLIYSVGGLNSARNALVGSWLRRGCRGPATFDVRVTFVCLVSAGALHGLELPCASPESPFERKSDASAAALLLGHQVLPVFL